MRRRRRALNIRYTSNQRHRTRSRRSIIGTDLAGTASYCVSDGVQLCFALSMLLLVQNRRTLSLAKENTMREHTSLVVFLVVAVLALLHWLLVYRPSWFWSFGRSGPRRPKKTGTEWRAREQLAGPPPATRPPHATSSSDGTRTIIENPVS